MSRIETKTGSQTYILNSYTGQSHISTVSNATNAYRNCDNASTTSYAQWSVNNGYTGYVYFVFDTSERTNIPSNATLTEISGRVSVRVSNTRTTNCNFRPYVGTTAKGSSTSFSGNTVTTRNMTMGAVSNWSLSDLADLRLYIEGKRNNYYSSYIRFHAADVTVSYSYDVYYYTISASCNQYGTVSPTSQEYEEGENCTITMTPNVAGFGPTKVLDNGVDVTSQIVEHNNGAYYTYEITGLAADHTIVVTFPVPVTHTISGTVASSLSVSPSLPQTVAEGDDFDLTITPTLPGTITVRDNNVVTETYVIDPDDIDSVIYTIENIVADHTLNITFVETTKYTISGTVGSGLTISPSLPVQKYAGTDTYFTITPSESGTITVNDNGDITTYAIPRDNVHSVTYSISSISESHTLALTFTPTQRYNITGTVDSHISISPSLPQQAYTGDDVEFTLTPNACGTIVVDDNGDITEFNIPRDNIHSVTYVIYAISTAHTLTITYEAPQQFQITGTVGSGVTCSPSLPQSVYTGDDLVLTLTPSGAGIIKVVDNNVLKANYEIPADDISAVTYSLLAIGESHTLNITYESLPQYTLSATEIASGLTISPTLPVTKYLGESQTITITPNAGGQITVIDNGNESAIFYITPENVHSVTYTLSSLASNHILEFKFSSLPQFTASATLTGSGSLSPSSVTEYAGRDITFTISSVPSSNIIIARNNGENVSKKVTHSGTTYTYTFTLTNDCNIEFISKVPGSVSVDAYIDEFGTVSPASTTVTEGDEYTLTITPQDYQSTATKPLSVSDNCLEVVDELVAKKDTSSSTYTATSETHSSIQSGTSYLTQCIGKTAENPSTSTSNAYASSGNTGYAIYSFDVSTIPANATITNVSCKVNGHLENSSIQSNRFCRVQLYANTTAKGTVQNFPSTSNTTMELEDVGTWTRSEVENIKLRMEVGYYGGLVCGISLTIEYEIDQTRYYYTTTIYEATEIYVKYKPDFYVKVKNQWKGRTLTSLLPKVDGKYRKVKKLFVKVEDEWYSVD